MNTIDISPVRAGLMLAIMLLIFGILMGIAFGIAEDSFKDFILRGVTLHPDLHDGNSPSKIWRYAQRAHFHATGIGAFSLGLIILVALSSLKNSLKKWASVLIGLAGLYPLAWFTTFILAPSLGRDAAHHHIITELLTYIGTGSLLIGLFLLFTNLLFGWFSSSYQKALA